MITTQEIPIEAMRPLNVRKGDHLHVVEERGGFFVVQIDHAPPVEVCKRGSAGAWARAALGSAILGECETGDDVRMAYYRDKYGIE